APFAAYVWILEDRTRRRRRVRLQADGPREAVHHLQRLRPPYRKAPSRCRRPHGREPFWQTGHHTRKVNDVNGTHFRDPFSALSRRLTSPFTRLHANLKSVYNSALRNCLYLLVYVRSVPCSPFTIGSCKAAAQQIVSDGL